MATVTLYVDPSQTTGAESGGGGGTDPTDPTDADNWTDAYLTLQEGLDDLVNYDSGSILYCRNGPTGTDIEEPTSAIDWDYTKTGSSSACTRVIGCGGLNGPDGTRYKIDWGTNSCNGLLIDNQDYYHLENFELVSSQSSGTYHGITFQTNYSSYMNLSNLYIHGWSGNGIDGNPRFYYGILVGSTIKDVGGYGVLTGTSSFHRCAFINCATAGIHSTSAPAVISNCLFVENGYGFYWPVSSYQYYVKNCVFHANDSDGIYGYLAELRVFNSRFTANGGYGINANRNVLIYGSYFQNNSSGTVVSSNGEVIYLNLDGTGHKCVLSGTDTDYGYKDTSSGDYNLDPSATLYDESLILP